MNLLALSTSTPRWSVWLHRQDGWARAVHAEAGRGTGQRASLTRIVWELLAQAELDVSQLQRVVCDVGPGSFTGLRQGLALARALAWANGIPTHAVGSLQAMALALDALEPGAGPRVVALPARADVDFVGVLQARTLTERALPTSDLATWWQATTPTVLAIPAADQDRRLAVWARAAGTPVVLLEPEAEVMGRWSLSQRDATSPLEPRYLAVSEAENHAGAAVPDAPMTAIDRRGGTHI